MAQLRRLDAEAAEEQLRELALVGQQAVATLASQARALRAWLGLELGLGLALALSLSLSLIRSLSLSLSPPHLPTHIAHQLTWPLTRARALLAPLHPFAYPPRHPHTPPYMLAELRAGARARHPRGRSARGHQDRRVDIGSR